MMAKMRRKCIAETLLVIVVYLMSLIGLHLVITRVFGFGNQDSLIILVPVILVSLPAAIYGYYVGFSRYYRRKANHLIQKK
jgi:ABC-type cobalt transport system substrate-binding protein